MNVSEIQKRHESLVKQYDKRIGVAQKKKERYLEILKELDTEINELSAGKKQLIQGFEKIMKKQEKLNAELNREIDDYLILTPMKEKRKKKSELNGSNIATESEQMTIDELIELENNRSEMEEALPA